MDPLSVAASVVGLVGVTAKVLTVLTNFIRETRNAPNLVNSILQEVSDISACLAQLQAFLLGTRVGSRSRTTLLIVEQVVVTLTETVMTFSELESILESLHDHTPSRITSRIAWTRKESVLARLCLRLNSSKQSLNLMLTTLTWYILAGLMPYTASSKLTGVSRQRFCRTGYYFGRDTYQPSRTFDAE